MTARLRLVGPFRTFCTGRAELWSLDTLDQSRRESISRRRFSHGDVRTGNRDRVSSAFRIV